MFGDTKLRKPSEKARCRWSNQPEGTRLTKKVGTIKNNLLINQFRRKGRRPVKDRIYLFQNFIYHPTGLHYRVQCPDGHFTLHGAIHLLVSRSPL